MEIIKFESIENKLTKEEKLEVIKKFDHLSKLQYSPHLPKVFTEKGLYMLATIINDYYDVNLKYGRHKELGIEIPNQVGNDDMPSSPSFSGLTRESKQNVIQSSKYPNQKFYKMDLADREAMEPFFQTEKFDVVSTSERIAA